jgi:branched-chain amino acid transport system substrate-binding protein
MKKLLVGLALLQTALAGPVLAKDYTIGAAFPMSGPNAEYGQVFSSAANLAAEHINADKNYQANSASFMRTAKGCQRKVSSQPTNS